jgi:cysteine desulfurase
VSRPVYLDCHATTPVDPRVVEAMAPYLTVMCGNPASRGHSYGWEAGDAVNLAREQVAGLINAADPNEIVFTSGATESDNLAIKGVAEARRSGHIITTAIEHKAILESCKRLASWGFTVTFLPVGTDGRVDPRAVATAIRPNTILVSVMLANNEIGTIEPLAEIGRLTRASGILLHTDAAQAAGKCWFDVQAMGVDLASLSAHKMYGPKGIGALYIRQGVTLVPQMDGGGQEGGVRSGTLPVSLIAGLGAACGILSQEGRDEALRVLALRERLRTQIFAALPWAILNGSLQYRLPGNLNVSFPGINGKALMNGLRDAVAVSFGCACATGSPDPSHVLTAIGVPADVARSSVRFGLGRFTTEQEVATVAGVVVQQVQQLSQAAA